MRWSSCTFKVGFMQSSCCSSVQSVTYFDCERIRESPGSGVFFLFGFEAFWFCESIMASQNYRNTVQEWDEKLEQCPYYPSHQIRPARFGHHLIQCRKALSKQPTSPYYHKIDDLVVCKFNSHHHIPRCFDLWRVFIEQRRVSNRHRILNKSSLNIHIKILIHFYINLGIAVIFDFVFSSKFIKN